MSDYSNWQDKHYNKHLEDSKHVTVFYLSILVLLLTLPNFTCYFTDNALNMMKFLRRYNIFQGRCEPTIRKVQIFKCPGIHLTVTWTGSGQKLTSFVFWHMQLKRRKAHICSSKQSLKLNWCLQNLSHVQLLEYKLLPGRHYRRYRASEWKSSRFTPSSLPLLYSVNYHLDRQS